MINRIQIHDCASYDSIGINWDELAQINFLYGNNGTGKTTISNAIRRKSKDEAVDNCSIDWDTTPLDCFVYNKQFVEENFSEDGKIPGVFTLGNKNIESQNEIIDKNNKLGDLEAKKKDLLDQKLKLENEQERLTKNLKDHIWKQIYKVYEKVFPKVFVGYRRKESFLKQILFAYTSIKDNKDFNSQEIQEKYNLIFSNELQPIDCIELPEDTISPKHTNTILDLVIVGNQDLDISALIKHLNNEDWVHQGLHYITKDSETCPFCQQKTISTEFRKKLEDFFDDGFNTRMSELTEFRQQYLNCIESYLKQMKSIESLANTKNLPNFNCSLFHSYLLSLEQTLYKNLQLIDSKIGSPSLKIKLENISDRIYQLKLIIDTCNITIKNNNNIVKNIEKEKRSISELIWNYLAFTQKNEIAAYYKKFKGKSKGITNLQKQINKKSVQCNSLQEDISTLQSSIASVLPTIEEINNQLALYGFTNFSLSATQDDHQYQIKRPDGSIAYDTLSEGERTFITFLYFMQLVKGNFTKENAITNRVIVIDDPISSLDSNILFIVSSLLKQEIKKIIQDPKHYYIKQIFILTHNIYFFKETSFIDGRNNERKEMKFWILRKNQNTSSLTPYGMKNPIHTSYEMLWEEYKQAPEDNITTVQNTMRRIIEHYFKILGRYDDDKILSKFEKTEEKEICRSLMCWVNDGSHCLSDDMFIELPENTITKYKKVFREIFIKLNHESHYNMMMQDN